GVQNILSSFNNIIPVTHNYHAFGYYPFTLVAAGTNGCVTTINETIIVQGRPDVDFIADTACLGTPTHFTDLTIVPGGSIQSWAWDFGDGSGSSNLQHPLYTYSNSGLYDVQLIVTSIGGCTDTLIQQVYVDASLAEFGFFNTCFGDTISFSDLSSTTFSGLTMWNWNFGDGTTASNVQYPVHFYTSSGTYTATLTITNAQGCTAQLSKNVEVIQPQASFNYSTGCLGTPVQFNDSTTSIGGPAIGWIWDFGDTSSSSYQQHPAHIYNNSGNFDVILIVTDSSGCKDTTMQSIQVNSPPSADFIADTTCSGSATNFADNSNGGGLSITSWYWIYGDGQTSVTDTLPIVSHIYAAPGSYAATLVIQNSNGCLDSVTKNVLIDSNSIPDFTYNNSCFGTPVQFTDMSTSTSSQISGWKWDFGDGSFTMQNNPVHLYNAPGSYNAILTVKTQKGCLDTISHIVEVYSLPQADFTATNTCLNSITQFADMSNSTGGNITSWNWTFAGNAISTLQNPVFTFGQPGNHYTELVVEDINGCIDTIAKQVHIDSLPEADFNYNVSCSGNVCSFNDMSYSSNGIIVDWYWNFGDQTNSTLQHPVHYYNQPGTYTVTLSVTDFNGCTDTVLKQITINPGFGLSFIFDTVCFGNFTTFNHAFSNPAIVPVTYFWDFGDGSSSSLDNPTHQYGQGGIYMVSLIMVDTMGCSDTVIHSVLVNSNPIAGFYSDTVMLGNPTHFYDQCVSAGSLIQVYQWNYGDGSPVDFTSAGFTQYTYQTAGSFNASLQVVDEHGCIGNTSKTVWVSSNYIHADFTSSNVCDGNTTHFTDLSLMGIGSISTWYWEFGDGNTSGLQHPDHQYNAPGIYNVTLIVGDGNLFFDTIQMNVEVFYNPQADFSSPHACAGTNLAFTNLSGISQGNIVNSQWDFGNGMSSSAMNPAIIYHDDGIYHVQLIVTSDKGCYDTIVKTVEVFPLPDLEITSDIVSDCKKTFASFCATIQQPVQNIVSWEWDFGDGAKSNTPVCAGHYYTNGGIFDVTLTVVSDNGCKAKFVNENLVEIFPDPVADFRVEEKHIPLSDPVARFTDLSTGASSWKWDFGDGTTSETQSTEHEYNKIGEYMVKLYVKNKFGCVDSTQTKIWIKAELGFYIPNAFTPNGDGLNDLFGPVVTDYRSDGYEFYVYNRFGSMVFNTNNLDEKWNGLIENVPVPAGVYAWLIIIKDGNGLRKKYQGTVTLIH
ncbi:PKD domain-containing protein, partial [candidate division KSB1 bacterium]